MCTLKLPTWHRKSDFRNKMFKIHDNMYKVIVILVTVIYSIAIQLLLILGLYTVRCSERIRVLYKIQSYRQLSIFISLYFIQNPYSQGNYSSKKWTPLSSTLKSFCQVFAILNGTTIHSRITPETMYYELYV